MSRKGSFAGRLENGPLDGGRGLQQFFSDVGAATVSPRVGFETAWGAREIRPSDVSKVCLRTEVEPDSAAAAHAGVCSRKSQSRNAAKAFALAPYAAFGIATDYGCKPAFASAKWTTEPTMKLYTTAGCATGPALGRELWEVCW